MRNQAKHARPEERRRITRRALAGLQTRSLLIKRNKHRFCANSNLGALALAFNFQIDAIRVTKPESSLAKIANRPTCPEFGVRSRKIFEFFEPVDFTRRAQARGPESANAKTFHAELVRFTLKFQRAAADRARADEGDLDLLNFQMTGWRFCRRFLSNRVGRENSRGTNEGDDPAGS